MEPISQREILQLTHKIHKIYAGELISEMDEVQQLLYDFIKKKKTTPEPSDSGDTKLCSCPVYEMCDFCDDNKKCNY